MKLVSYLSDAGPRLAALVAGGYVDLNEADAAVPPSILQLLRAGPAGLERAGRAATAGHPQPLDDLRLLPAVPNPEKVICVGLNYADHAKETGKEAPAEPIFFNKFPTALCADGHPIELPPQASQVDYEAELVAVIGRGGRNIPHEYALKHVAGYCCGNDVSARDWQFKKPGGQWLLGKSFDTFAPLGPALAVTADEIPDPGNLRIQLRLNGETMQNSTTAQLIFSIAALIAYVSQVCTLATGDLIFTGTPAGVGTARKPPVFLKPGDSVEVEIERVGTLRNPVRAAS